MDSVTRIPGVAYTNGTSIPPGLSGFYLGKTASTTPHATAQPIDPPGYGSRAGETTFEPVPSAPEYQI
jgi:hypothetical protein